MAIRTYHDLDVFLEAYAAALDVSAFANGFLPWSNTNWRDSCGEPRDLSQRILLKDGASELRRRNLNGTCKSQLVPAMKPGCGWI